jgi:hypothetical protein
LHKMVLYDSGDFFETHIDSPHLPGMVFSLVVELHSENELSGGELIFPEPNLSDNYTPKYQVANLKKPYPLINEISATLFYHDTRHKVTKVEKGFRIVLTFDVVQKSTILTKMIEENLIPFKYGIEKLKNHGFKSRNSSKARLLWK